MTILTGGCHRGRGGRGRCGSPRREADGGGRRHLPRHPDPAAHFPLTISNVGVARQLDGRRWGYWDLNPDQRVSTAGRGCLATLYDLRVIAPVSRHWSGRRRSSADPLAIIPVTGARDAAWLHYIPIRTVGPCPGEGGNVHVITSGGGRLSFGVASSSFATSTAACLFSSMHGNSVS